MQNLVRSGGCDGVIVTRLVSRDERVRYVPGTRYSTSIYYRDPYWRFWRVAYDEVYTPGYLENETAVRVETNIWSTRGDGELVWSGTSELIDPHSAESASKKIATGVADALAETRLI